MTSRFEMAYDTMSSATAWLLYVADAVYSLSFIYNSPLSFRFGNSIHVFSNSTFFGSRSPPVLALCVKAVGIQAAGLDALPGFWIWAFSIVTYTVMAWSWAWWVEQDEKAHVQ